MIETAVNFAGHQPDKLVSAKIRLTPQTVNF